MKPQPMSSANSETPLTLDLYPSRWLLGILAGSHLLALASLFAIALPLILKALLAALVVVSWLYYHSRLANRNSHDFIKRLSYLPGKGWNVESGDGCHQPTILIGSYVHPYLVVLNFALSRWKRRSVVLLADSAEPESIRQLRVLLRTQSESLLNPAEPLDLN